MISRVQRPDEKLAELVKPSIELTHEILLRHDDILVVCAGFEPRSLEVLRRTKSLSLDDGKILIIDYRPENENNRYREVVALSKSVSNRLESIIYARETPQGFADTFLQRIQESTGRLFIDISSMSRFLIVQLVVGLKLRPEGYKNVCLMYTEAATYPPTKEDAEEALETRRSNPSNSMMLISSGVLDICVVPELSSTYMQGQPTRLITFPSFNIDQLTALISFVQPPFTTCIHGIPPDPALSWRPEIIKALNHIESYNSREEFNASTIDYRETLEILLEIYRLHGDIEKIIVSPIGSKMQAVAVGLFRAFLNDVQIVYPAANQFATPSDYTDGARQVYKLELGKFNEV